ncbi:hypothetical protein [Stenotrophomonas sp. PD6]|uniref:hypothetical protein n=1 Tax=Stenotrophomonas sp. PD6 TaxID=3368612 RepID=UPI003BA28828
MSEIDLYARSDLWRRLPEGVCVRYTVLTHTKSGLFAVQSADYFSDDDPRNCARFFQQFIVLLREQSPLERCEWFETAEAAILAHDKHFADLEGGSPG